MSKKNLFCIILFIIVNLFFLISHIHAADDIAVPKTILNFGSGNNPEDMVSVMKIVFLLTFLALAPAILVMVTPFTRLIIVFSFLRQAIGIPQIPPNQILIGLALIITFFIMAPIGMQINNEALQPYLNKQISQEEALNLAFVPLRRFMLKQTREKDLALMIKISKSEKPKNYSEIGNIVLISAFIISELKTSFQIGFMIYMPFLIIDMVVACILMSMGMVMLPPIMISLPFKLLLFVMADGWHLITKSLIVGFN